MYVSVSLHEVQADHQSHDNTPIIPMGVGSYVILSMKYEKQIGACQQTLTPLDFLAVNFD